MKLFGLKFGHELNTYIEGHKMGYVFIGAVGFLVVLCVVALIGGGFDGY